MTELPRRAFVRTAKLASLPIGAAGRAAVGVGKRIGGQPAAAVSAELQARTAEQIFAVLGELKGGAMKVGQALSVMEGAVPDELYGPYREALARLQEAAPPIPAEAVQRVLRRHLGPDWRELFLDFDDRAVASASIGQVHRATWADGRDVAVKVQYPGAGRALVGDVRRISAVTRVATAWVPGLDLRSVLDAILDRVAEELDYEREARCQHAVALAFAGDPHIVVPDVVAQRGDVLVTEWMDGTPLLDVIRSGSQRERDAAAARYLEFLISGPERARHLHADPHPGNFRILSDGRLGVLDFGAVDILPDGLPEHLGPLLHLALIGQGEELVRGLQETGFIAPGSSIRPQLLVDFLAPFLDPLRVSTFRFQRSWLRGHAVRMQDPRRADFGLGLRLHLPSEYLLIHRVWLGGIAVLCQLDADVEARAIVDRWVPGALISQLPVERP